MNWTLEVVKVPVADLDRARAFYAGQLGFPVDFEATISDDQQFLQMTPPGSGCSIILSKGMTSMAPGSLDGPQLVVSDIRAAHAQLVANGVDAGEVQVAGRDGSFRPAQDGETGAALDNVGIVFFSDPDGNRWAVQQVAGRG